MEVKMTKLILLVSLGLLGACTISGEVAPPVVVNSDLAKNQALKDKNTINNISSSYLPPGFFKNAQDPDMGNPSGHAAAERQTNLFFAKHLDFLNRNRICKFLSKKTFSNN